MIFIVQVGYFVTERRFYLDIEYNLTTAGVENEKGQGVIKTIDEFITVLPWHEPCGIFKIVSDEKKGKVQVRVAKILARKNYTKLMMNPREHGAEFHKEFEK